MKCVVLFQSIILKVAQVSTGQTLTLSLVLDHSLNQPSLVLAHSLNPLACICQ